MVLSKSRQYELLTVLTFMRLQSQQDVNGSFSLVMEQLSVTKKNIYEALNRLELLNQQFDATQQQLKGLLRDYAFQRLGSVEKAILLVLGSLIVLQEEDASVVTEGIKLAHKYASPEAGSLVHALLSALVAQVSGASFDESELSSSIKTFEEAEANVQHLCTKDSTGECST